MDKNLIQNLEYASGLLQKMERIQGQANNVLSTVRRKWAVEDLVTRTPFIQMISLCIAGILIGLFCSILLEPGSGNGLMKYSFFGIVFLLVFLAVISVLHNRAVAPGNAKKAAQAQQILQGQAPYLDEWNAQVSGWYPPSYCTSHAANSFIEYLRNGRADDLRQCMDLYEQDCYRQGMHEKAQRTLEATQRVAEETAQVKAAVRETNFLLWWKD